MDGKGVQESFWSSVSRSEQRIRRCLQFFFLTHWTEHVKVCITGYKVYLSEGQKHLVCVSQAGLLNKGSRLYVQQWETRNKRGDGAVSLIPSGDHCCPSRRSQCRT